ncbi:MAG: hypothetical protein NVSMB4_00590 [Acidimicrobiales bacterium]
MPDHFTKDEEAQRRINTVEDARRAHHLASADPELDGTMTGPAHEEKYGLERAEASAAAWRAAGVHPTENRALVGDEEGAENLRGVGENNLGGDAEEPKLERADTQPDGFETTAAPSA